MKELIQKLTETYGPSGHEESIREVIRAEVQDWADEIQVDALGNLIAVKRGQGGGKKIMLSAHMDEIGVMISYVDEKGFLRFQPIGGLDLATLAGSRMYTSMADTDEIIDESLNRFEHVLSSVEGL